MMVFNPDNLIIIGLLGVLGGIFIGALKMWLGWRKEDLELEAAYTCKCCKTKYLYASNIFDCISCGFPHLCPKCRQDHWCPGVKF